MAEGRVNIIVSAEDKTKGAFGGAMKGMQGLGKAAGLAIVSSAAVAGVAVAGLAVKGITSFIAFEDQMNEVFTLLPGISGTAMDQMSRQVLNASEDMGRLPEEVIPALYQSLSAGVPADNVFEFMETAHQAALGGVADLDVAVDGITSVINAYGTDVLGATEASDKMFTAVRLGKTDFNQLSSSLFNVIPTAASMGVQFGDVAASLATLTAQGTPTATATTQLRGALVEASKGGTKLDTAIKDLTGASFPELIEQGETMPGIFETLRDSMPDQQFKDLFGSVDAMNAVLGITGPNFDTVSDAMKEMDESAGATEAAYDTMNTGMARTVEVLKVKMETTFIKIGTALAPLVEAIGGKLMGVLEDLEPIINTLMFAFEGFFENISGGMDPIEAIKNLISNLMITVFGEGVESAMEFQDAFDDIRGKVEEFIEKVQEVIAIVWEFVEPIAQAAIDFVEFKDVLIALGIVLAVTIIPILASIVISIASILLPVLAVIAIVALLRTAWEENFLGIQEKVQAVIEFVREIIERVVTAIKVFWDENGDAILAKAQEIWTNIQLAIQTAILVVQTTIETVVAAIRQFWEDHGAAILQSAADVWQAIQDAVQFAIDYIQTYVGAFMLLFQGDFEGFGRQLREAWNMVWDKITEILETVIPVIIEFLSGLILDIIDKFQSIDWGKVGSDIIRGIADGITAAASWIRDAAVNAARAAFEAVTGFFSSSSPSKLMMGVGLDVGKGLAIGIDNSSGIVASAGTRMATAGYGATQQVGSTANDNRQYILNVNSQESTGNIATDFELMEAMIG